MCAKCRLGPSVRPSSVRGIAPVTHRVGLASTKRRIGIVADYEHIAKYYRDHIRDGRLEPGAILPDVNQLAQVWSVDRQVVIEAMLRLKREGLLVPRGTEMRVHL